MTHSSSAETIDWITRLQTNLGWLSRVIYARVEDRHATEDVLQEMALAAESWPPTLDGNGAVHRWLYAVAVKQAMLYVRSRIRRHQRTERYASDHRTPTIAMDAPESRLIASENVVWVREALKELSPRQREVLLLKYFDELTCREISQRIGIEETTVKRHLVDARKRLRQVLLQLRNDDYEPT